ncbi:MAG: ABC transporter ATP-binding protein [Fimbriimonadaceae bacterium]
MSKHIVEAHALVKTYFDAIEVPVLRGISLRIEPEEFLAIMGQSGSGKSTLLNILGCLDRPTSGTLVIDGQDTADLADNQLAALRSTSIGFVFQSHLLLDEFSCLENALMPILIAKGEIGRGDNERVVGLIERVGLTPVMHRKPASMSGGEKQRCAIVRALANGPRLLLADEPTGNLDSTNGKEIFSLLREVSGATGAATVLVTHDDRLALQADRVVSIRDGMIRDILEPSKAHLEAAPI